MNIRRTVLSLAVLGLGLSQIGFGQIATSARPSSQRVLGYFDPTTGIFQPVRPAAESEPVTATTETGELIVKFTITVKTAMPKNSVIGCSGNANTGDAAGSYEEHASAIATLVSGSTYTCSSIIHYSWLLDTPTTDPVGITGGASIQYGYQATAFNGSDTVVVPTELRSIVPGIPSLKSVPANGLTTTINVNVTL